MKWITCPVLLTLAVMFSACTGTTVNKTRQLTCLGFCSDTGVEHNKTSTEETAPRDPALKERP